MFEINVDNKTVIDTLDRLASALSNPRPYFLGIGDGLVLSTKRRFETGTAPDGTPWAENSQTTYLQQLVDSKGGKLKSYHRKDGRINSRGAEKMMGKKPLIGRTRLLSQQIYYQVNGNELSWGSPMKYAAMQNFGGTKSEFPHLWGDIPARQFMGISESDEEMIISTASDYLRSVIG